MTEINIMIISLCVGLIFVFYAITKKIKERKEDRRLNEGREGLRHQKVDTPSRKPKQNLFEDDVIYIDNLRQIKPLQTTKKMKNEE